MGTTVRGNIDTVLRTFPRKYLQTDILYKRGKGHEAEFTYYKVMIYLLHNLF